MLPEVLSREKNDDVRIVKLSLKSCAFPVCSSSNKAMGKYIRRAYAVF